MARWNINNHVEYMGINVGRRDILEIVNKDNVLYWAEYIKYLFANEKDDKRSHSKRYVYSESINLCNFLIYVKFNLNDKSVLEITDKDIENYLYYNKKVLQHSSNTINGIISRLKKFYNYLIYREIISQTPFTNVSIQVTKNAKYQTLSETQIKELKQKLPLHLKLYLLFSISTGCVITDILYAKWENVDFENRIVYVSENNDNHILYFNKEVSNLLQEEKFIREKNGAEDNGYIFRNYINNKIMSTDIPIKKNIVNKWNKQMGDIIAFPELKHTILRHTGIKTLMKKSKSIGMTGLIMNHKHLSTHAIKFALEESEENNELLQEYKDICEL